MEEGSTPLFAPEDGGSPTGVDPAALSYRGAHEAVHTPQPTQHFDTPVPGIRGDDLPSESNLV